MQADVASHRELLRTTLRLNEHAPHRVRLVIRSWLGAAHPAVDDAELVASELVTNALKHVLQGPDRDWVRLRLDEEPSRVRLDVTDPGNPRSAPRRLSLPIDQEDWIPQPGGMGIATVAEICDEVWGTYLTRRGARVVWCYVPVRRRPDQYRWPSAP
ncbi:ATP-binding protein [Nonomuraea sp. K274]|uniref:ATP-binding protein n=1 Tax=Nonomuraea cypriaca TaxID=1187855 RepID=A0A931AN20_9ACTN|nr:ATP-binding protein [Nonomuraea cypriaca]MBF8193989.1 ATP-binding protein [Nonomuraea cypriaca]